MSSFARAAARASGGVRPGALAPALATASPLARSDQRLNLPEFVDALGRGAVGLGPAIAGPAELGLSANPVAESVGTRPASMASATDFGPAGSVAWSLPAEPTAETSRANETSTGSMLQPARPEAAALSSALSAVDRWMRQPPRVEESSVSHAASSPALRGTAQPSESALPGAVLATSASLAGTRRDHSRAPSTHLAPPAPAAQPPPLATRLTAVMRPAPLASQSGGVAPFTVASAPVSAPLLKIGRIDVRVVQAPERRAPALRAARRVSAPRAPTLPGRAPYGWRQR